MTVKVSHHESFAQSFRGSARELRLACARLREEFREAEARGDDLAALRCVEELELSLGGFKALRSSLTPTERFIAEFNVETTGNWSKPHGRQVSLNLPSGVSRRDLLHRAQEVTRSTFCLDSVWTEQMLEWNEDPRFLATSEASTRIELIGHVEGTAGKSIDEQRQVLQLEGLRLPRYEDLVVAHVAFFVATRETIFGTHRAGESYAIREDGGRLLCFFSDGLSEFGPWAQRGQVIAAAGIRVPPEAGRVSRSTTEAQ